jgi:hypothetical protein
VTLKEKPPRRPTIVAAVKEPLFRLSCGHQFRYPGIFARTLSGFPTLNATVACPLCMPREYLPPTLSKGILHHDRA